MNIIVLYTAVWVVAIFVANTDLCYHLRRRGVHSLDHWVRVVPWIHNRSKM
jgi:hypothetical protein